MTKRKSKEVNKHEKRKVHRTKGQHKVNKLRTIFIRIYLSSLVSFSFFKRYQSYELPLTFSLFLWLLFHTSFLIESNHINKNG